MTTISSIAQWSRLARKFPRSGEWPIFVAPDTFRWGRDRAAEEAFFETGVGIREVFHLGPSAWGVAEDDYCFECGNTRDRTGELSIESAQDDFVTLGELDVAADATSTPTVVRAARPCQSLLEIEWPGILNIGWNPAEAMIILRSWEDRFGAVPLSISDSTLSLVVARPPRTIEEARMVAREHLHFCPYDTQFHGFGGISPYVAKLVGSRVWNFWWD